MYKLNRRFGSAMQKAHDRLKWLLSTVSATATIGFVVFLETA
jgi:hypothetical protein